MLTELIDKRTLLDPHVVHIHMYSTIYSIYTLMSD